MINNYIVFCLFICCVGSLQAQEIFNPENYDFDCTGKVEMPRLTVVLYVYDGDDPNIETVQKIIKVRIGTKWKKVKADKNCLSPDPNDCLVWCLAEDVEEKKILTVIDTASTKEWHMKEIEIRPKGNKMNLPVVCKYQLSTELLLALRDKLFALDYNVNPTKKYTNLKGKINQEFKKFQSDHDLPVGKWTEETMRFLYNLETIN